MLKLSIFLIWIFPNLGSHILSLFEAVINVEFKIIK